MWRRQSIGNGKMMMKNKIGYGGRLIKSGLGGKCDCLSLSASTWMMMMLVECEGQRILVVDRVSQWHPPEKVVSDLLKENQADKHTPTSVYSHLSNENGQSSKIGQAFIWFATLHKNRKTSSNKKCAQTHSLGSQPKDNQNLQAKLYSCLLFCDNVGSGIWLQQ